MNDTDKLSRTFYRAHDDAVIAEPPADWLVPIAAGSWRRAPRGFRQVRCEDCEALLGISPWGWSYHIEQPLHRPILCLACHNAYRAEEHELWILIVERVREHAPARKRKLRQVQ